jgi:hypothetical protein
VLEIFMSWAIFFTGYPKGAPLPPVEIKSRSWFVEHVCYGRENCGVIGWYNDTGIIYLRDDSQDRDDIVVHEMVHYLQDLYGGFPDTCEGRRARESEAYTAQYRYLMRNGSMLVISMPVHFCPGEN